MADGLKERSWIEILRRTVYRGMTAAAVPRAVSEAVVLPAESVAAAGLALGRDIRAGAAEHAIGIVSEAEAFTGKRAGRTGKSAADGRGAEAWHRHSSITEKARARRAFH